MISYFFIGILLLGIITSYEDFRYGKIRNKWIILCILYSSVIYAIIGISNFEAYSNIIFAITIGFILYYLGVWSAGDGKLFIGFCFLIPVQVYIIGYQAWIPSISFLVNIFVIGIVVIMFYIIPKIGYRHFSVITKFGKEFFSTKKLAYLMISLFSISWVIKLLLSLVDLQDNMVIIFCFSILIFSWFEKNKSRTILVFVLLLAAFRLFFDKSIFSLYFLSGFLLSSVIWRFFRTMVRESISNLTNELFMQDISIDKLLPGMILGDVIVKKGKLNKSELAEFKKKDIVVLKHKGEHYLQQQKTIFGLNSFIDEDAEGITAEQIQILKKLGVTSIKICHTIPFAPIIFGGALLTVILKGNILIIAFNWFF